MKIFNWVQRKFNHIGIKDEEFGKKEESQEMMTVTMTMTTESQTLLVDGSILSIGTFGYHQPNSYKEIKAEQTQGENDDGFDSEDDDNESEANPLVLTTFKHDLDMSSLDGICSSEITDYSSDSWEYKKMIGERTTLADLFLADSEVKLNLNPVQKLVLNKTEIQQQQPDWLATKSNTLHFTKKLVPQPRPVNKLNQLMRRMMRRKIHPDLGQRNAPAVHDKNVEARELESLDESAYLLPSPEVVG